MLREGTQAPVAPDHPLSELLRSFEWCPIEAGVLGYLADNECAHGRLPTDKSDPCGCWPQEAQLVPYDPDFARLQARRTRTAISTEEARELMNTTTEAPFGYKKDGTPRKRPVPHAAHAARRAKRAIASQDAAALTNGDFDAARVAQEMRSEATRLDAQAERFQAKAQRLRDAAAILERP